MSGDGWNPTEGQCIDGSEACVKYIVRSEWITRSMARLSTFRCIPTIAWQLRFILAIFPMIDSTNSSDCSSG